MNLPFDFRKTLSQDNFVLKTQRQLIKDFGTSGIDFPSSYRTHPIPVDQLISDIALRLSELQSSSSTSFSQLLYQIDLPESMLAELAQTDQFYLSLAEVILKREAYKVYLREKYSS